MDCLVGMMQEDAQAPRTRTRDVTYQARIEIRGHERKKKAGQKEREQRKPSCGDASRSLPAKRGEETARVGDVERQYGGRRGRTRDKMAASGKLAAEKQRPIDPLRARAHSHAATEFLAVSCVASGQWQMKSQTLTPLTRGQDPLVSVFEHRHGR
ncbi:hypothetical protein G5I_05014 [Acromyrmex echinatior]|uniref:Uncharacterized protein n=1 Tax=Acromyrmex echinatior TaxID=103372 RepID=F4WH60_ACREC|nr:hypothetical protein G5I_05014 [Acromyrmex echinatior]